MPVYNCYSIIYCRWCGFHLPILINTSKGDFKFAFHCQEILLHCFDVCLPKSSLTYKSPHVLITFNPSESIDIKVFMNISILCQKNSWHNYSWQQLLDLLAKKKKGKKIRNRLNSITPGRVGCCVMIGCLPARQSDRVWRSHTAIILYSCQRCCGITDIVCVCVCLHVLVKHFCLYRSVKGVFM